MAAKQPAAPMTDDDDDQPAAGAADTGAEGAEPEEQGEVIATLLANKDGTYTVIAGDEDDDEEGDGEESEGAEGGEAGEGEAAPEAGAEGGEEGEAAEPGEGTEGGEEEPEHQNYETAGEALKGILDIIRSHEASKGGEDEFTGGYKGEGGGEGEESNTVKYQG